jgi:hypothetical protein
MIRPHVHVNSPEQTNREDRWRTEEKRNWRNQLWPQWLLAGTASLTMVGGIFSVFILHRTLQATRDQASATIAQLHASQRPWVGIVESMITVDELAFGDTTLVRPKFTLKNMGVSVANSVDPIMVLMSGKMEQIQKSQREIYCLPAKAPSPLTDTIFPEQEKLVQNITFELGRTAIITDQQGKTVMWLVGCIYYWDQFQKPHRTPVLYVFETSGRVNSIRPQGKVRGYFKAIQSSLPAD